MRSALFAGSVHIESRSGDSRSVQAEALRRKPGESACPLVHVEDPSFTGSAFVDTEYGVVTEFETPAQSLLSATLAGSRANVPVLKTQY